MVSLNALLEIINSAYLYTSTFNTGLYKCPDGNMTPYEACCPFYALRDDLQANLFDRQCGEDVHEVLRLAFHDAITYSYTLEHEGKFPGGGADGSVLAFPDVEANYPANLGISDSINALLPFLDKHDVSPGDMVQFAAAVGITNCPGAPRLQFLAGRPNATAPGPIGLIPEPQDSVDKILSRMADGGGFSPSELVALLSSHSIARADHVDPRLKAAPFDTTPFTFDTQFFLEVLLKGVGFPTGGSGKNIGEVESPLPVGTGDNVGELRLQSDFALARDPRTACTWQGFISEQELMSKAFAVAMAKLAVNAQDVYRMVDCSVVVPAATPANPKPATYPATKSQADVEQACRASPFPSLTSDKGTTETIIPHCPDGETDCDGS